MSVKSKSKQRRDQARATRGSVLGSLIDKSREKALRRYVNSSVWEDCIEPLFVDWLDNQRKQNDTEGDFEAIRYRQGAIMILKRLATLKDVVNASVEPDEDEKQKGSATGP